MKKLFSLSLIFLGSVAGWSTDAVTHSRQIDCSIERIDRASIHPDGTSPFVGVKDEETSSYNWSGYVSATNLQNPTPGSVDAVSGNWVVPTLMSTSNNAYCAVWVGIDGFTSGTVEQIGTSHNWINGQQRNSAWFEMYPQGSYNINGFPVDNGDQIGGAVSYLGNGVFRLALHNYTKGVHTIIPASYTTSATAQRSCAEWVVEAPWSGGILPLSDFGSETFTGCTTKINNISGAISSPYWVYDAITMVANNNIIKALPSGLAPQGHRFSVAWEHE